MRQVAKGSDKLKAAVLLTALCLISCISQAQPSQRQVARHKGYLNSPYGYWEYLPENYQANNNHPVVIYLHGIKNIGNGTSELKEVLSGGPPSMVATQEKNFPFILISPQSAGMQEGFSPQKVDSLIDIIKNNYRVDPDRIYVTGLSFGGYATWRIATYASEKLAAIVPICSCAPPEASLLKNVAIWGFVNSGDYEVPACMGETLEAIRHNGGGNHLLTVYPKDGHNAWRETYNSEKMWSWILAQRKSHHNENQTPALITPGDQKITIGYPQSFSLLVGDVNPDNVTLTIEGPLPPGVKFEMVKKGQGVFTVISKTPGVYPITVVADDGKGKIVKERFMITVGYSPLLPLTLALFILQPLAWAIFSLRRYVTPFMNLIIKTASLLRRALSWVEGAAIRNNIL